MDAKEKEDGADGAVVPESSSRVVLDREHLCQVLPSSSYSTRTSSQLDWSL